MYSIRINSSRYTRSDRSSENLSEKRRSHFFLLVRPRVIFSKRILEIDENESNQKTKSPKAIEPPHCAIHCDFVVDYFNCL